MFYPFSRALFALPLVLSSQASADEGPRIDPRGVAMLDTAEGSGPAAQEDDEALPDTALERARDLGLSGDDNRPESQRVTTLLGTPLILGGEVSSAVRGRMDYDLERGARDDILALEPQLKLEAIWIPSGTTVGFAAIRAFAEQDIYREGGRSRGEVGVALDSFWILSTDLFGTPLAVQVGRQRLRERREFWWDDTVDGARLLYFGENFTAFAGVGVPVVNLSTRGRTDPEDSALIRVFANAAWEWTNRQHLELYALHQIDRSRGYNIGETVQAERADDADANLTWTGARVRGCVRPGFVRRICYWADIARVRGSETAFEFNDFGRDQLVVDAINGTRVRGWAYDIGGNFELPLPLRPVLTLARASGSGDRPGTPGVNYAFRQTGLHGNDARYRGMARFRSYGEVLRPDLSNIRVSTVALGLPLGEHGWLETLWHRYRQPFADDRVRNSPIGENPDGIDPRLGEEFDIVLSHRPRGGWEFELTAGAFRAGPAFGPEQDRWAGLVEVKVDYNF